MIVCAGVLGAAQPHGIWVVGPFYVVIVAALKLDRRAAWLLFAGAVLPFLAGYSVKGQYAGAGTFLSGIVPWFFAMRLLRYVSAQRDALQASRAAEAQAAAAAERGDELPGSERIGALADAFKEQSGLPVAVEVCGEPRELAPEARLAVYRTAQEALTNVRRHATAERVEVRLDYGPDSTVLVVEDHALLGSPPLPALSLSGGYGLAGMRERAELLGGELLAAPTPSGFRIELRLPAAE